MLLWDTLITHAKIEFYQDIHEEVNDLQLVKFVISKISRQFEGAHTEESCENLYFSWNQFQKLPKIFMNSFEEALEGEMNTEESDYETCNICDFNSIRQ